MKSAKESICPDVILSLYSLTKKKKNNNSIKVSIINKENSLIFFIFHFCLAITTNVFVYD